MLPARNGPGGRSAVFGSRYAPSRNGTRGRGATAPGGRGIGFWTPLCSRPETAREVAARVLALVIPSSRNGTRGRGATAPGGRGIGFWTPLCSRPETAREVAARVLALVIPSSRNGPRRPQHGFPCSAPALKLPSRPRHEPPMPRRLSLCPGGSPYTPAAAGAGSVAGMPLCGASSARWRWR